jgi:hypothetical protein
MLMVLFCTSNKIEVKEEMKKIARQKLQFSQQVLVLHVKRGQAAQKEAQLRRSFIDKLKELKVPPPHLNQLHTRWLSALNILAHARAVSCRVSCAV